jgi:hypothetical protein
LVARSRIVEALCVVSEHRVSREEKIRPFCTFFSAQGFFQISQILSGDFKSPWRFQISMEILGDLGENPVNSYARNAKSKYDGRVQVHGQHVSLRSPSRNRQETGYDRYAKTQS